MPAVALLVGAFAAATIATAGDATAQPNRAPTGDTTGAHRIDPNGYHHTDANPLQQNEHRNALRDYRNQQNPAESTGTGGNGATTWTPMPRPDGDGWVVCRTTASWC